jgi:hypothetical protein
VQPSGCWLLVDATRIGSWLRLDAATIASCLFIDTANRKLAACRGRPIGSQLLEYAANERLASR